MERKTIVNINNKNYTIYWDISLDGKRWARIGEISNNKITKAFGKFKTKKTAKNYLETYYSGRQ